MAVTQWLNDWDPQLDGCPGLEQHGTDVAQNICSF